MILITTKIETPRKMIVNFKKRAIIYLIAIFLFWPFISVMLATLAALKLPYYEANFSQALMISFSGLLISSFDLILVCTLLYFLTITLFSLLESYRLIRPSEGRTHSLLELILFYITILLGTALYYPAILSQPVFGVIQFLPVWLLTLLLAATVTFLSAYLAVPSCRVFIQITIIAIGILIPAPGIWRNSITPEIPLAPPTVLIGVDSLSQHDQVDHLKDWTESKGGVWHKKAVAPGLLTNSVWTSILLAKTVKDHGIFHIWQNCSDSSNSSLPKKAKKHGYLTISMFSNQLTCWAGSSFSFDLDESGPVGWRQLASSLFENASILLPHIKPLIPQTYFSGSPPNHSGSYSYSIERQLREIFSKESEIGTPLVFAHINYLHEQIYPKYIDLSWEEFKRVLLSPAYSISDRSLDWQDKDLPDDAIPIHNWKTKHLQLSIVDAIEKMHFLENHGKMIIFSDHGDRLGLSCANFHEHRFNNVIFATFNLPKRDPEIPISTIECGSTLELYEDEIYRPLVEYAHIQPQEWLPLLATAEFSWDGRISLDKNMLSTIFARTKSHEPFYLNE